MKTNFEEDNLGGCFEKVNCYINQFITQPIGNRTLKGLFYILCGVNYESTE